MRDSFWLNIHMFIETFYCENCSASPQKVTSYHKVGVLPIRIAQSNVSSVGHLSETFVQRETFLSDKGPTLETLDYTIRIGSTPTFLYFDLYLYSAYAAHYVYTRYNGCKGNHVNKTQTMHVKRAFILSRNILSCLYMALYCGPIIIII